MKLGISLPDGDNFGWGICGRNLRRVLAKKVELIDYTETKYPIPCDQPVLHCVSGPTFLPLNQNVWSKTSNIGYAFIEDFQEAKKHIHNARRYYSHIVCGSTWCAERLRELDPGIPVSVAIQGVDHAMFTPRKVEPSRKPFFVFSGGKWEYRKGQDIVVEAFQKLYTECPDMHLLAAWHNPWPETAKTMWFKGVSAPTPEAAFMVVGIPEDRYTLIPPMPNYLMAAIYKMASVAVFPNRCEAGNNMVMCEVMACGVPTLATAATGHRDVFFGAPIISQTLANGWAEPSVDDLVHLLETGYTHSQEKMTNFGVQASLWMAPLTWEKTADNILKLL